MTVSFKNPATTTTVHNISQLLAKYMDTFCKANAENGNLGTSRLPENEIHVKDTSRLNVKRNTV
jgi:hypothetical protein